MKIEDKKTKEEANLLFSSFLGQNQDKSLPSSYQVGKNSASNHRHLYHSKQKKYK